MSRKPGWYHVTLDEGVRHSYKILREVFHGRSRFQDIAVYDLAGLARTLVLDSRIQSSEVDEYIYHEALVHPGLLAHADPKRVFIAGGGEGATLREVLRHRSVERVTMVEIDELVVNVCKTYLPEMHKGSFDDPRVYLRFADARAYLDSDAEKYDAIVIDASDPDERSPSRRLFTREFYCLCKNRLRKDGILVVQADVVSTRGDHLFLSIVSTLKSVFEAVSPYWAHIPSFCYPWGFVICFPFEAGQLSFVGDGELSQRIIGELRYYDADTHRMSTMFSRTVRVRLEASVDRQLTDNGALFDG